MALPKINSLSPRWQTALAFALILAVSLIAYSNSFKADFFLDDTHQILNNSSIRNLSDIPKLFTDPYSASSTRKVTGYRPLTMASFALNYALSGYDTTSYHVFNFALHAFNAMLVYLMLSMLMRTAGRKGSILPLAVSAIFAAHPLQTGAVTYISGRSVLLASFFCLLSFIAFLRFRSGRDKGAPAMLMAVLSPAAFGLALLCKEMSVFILGIMVLYDILFQPASGKRARAWLYYLPFLSILALFLFLRNALMGYATAESALMTRGVYLMSQSKALLVYLRLLLLPINQNADYNVPPTVTFDPGVAAGVAVLAVGLYLIYRARRRLPLAAFFGGWFLVAMAPESTLVPIQDIIVEYRVYIASVGFFAAAFVLMENSLKPALLKGFTAAVLVLFCALTVSRNDVRATEISLWTDVAAKSPYSARAHLNLGVAYAHLGVYEEAVKELKQALAVNVGETETLYVYNNLGICYMKLGMQVEAAATLKKVLEISPDNDDARINLADVYFAANRFADAVDVLLPITKTNPMNALAYERLGAAYGMLGRGKEALAAMGRAVELSPKSYEVHFNSAQLYARLGMKPQAYEEARVAANYAADEASRQAAINLMESVR